jgi:preprotein translocase subunit SecE
MNSPKEWWKKARDFFVEVVTEVKKCSFPSRDEVIGTTTVVLITSVAFSLFLWVADILIIKGYEGLLKVFS